MHGEGCMCKLADACQGLALRYTEYECTLCFFDGSSDLTGSTCILSVECTSVHQVT